MSQTEVQLIKSSSVVDGDIVGMSSSKLSGALPAISGANLTGLSSGITMTDQWRITSNFNHGPGSGTITSNWEQNDTLSGDITVGSSMTESSGVFTFPSTGIYLIRAYMNAVATSISYAGIIIRGTTDNFSSVDVNLANNYDSCGSGTSYYACVMCEAFFDVANTSVNKVKFNLNSQNTIQVEGTTDYQRTGVTFIRFGDT
tara:strand:- start:3 stop:605 length:603 start_codon:yes stop_codon:yes gene_type:complete